MKVENYFNCSSLLRREAGREGVQRAGEGFTLAEVLIALTVIGVISAITVPVLMQNTNKQEYVTGLKKAYSTLSQATNQIIAEEGNPSGNDGWLKHDKEWTHFSSTAFDLYKKHLNNAKECGTGTGCFPQMNISRYKSLGGAVQNWWSAESSGYRKLVLADGVQVMFANTSQIWADVNGAKGPNTNGRDLFVFNITNNGLVPNGCSNNSADCKIGGTGHTCACKVLREGAMNY